MKKKKKLLERAARRMLIHPEDVYYWQRIADGDNTDIISHLLWCWVSTI